jgi:hypothetical protein
MVVGGFLVSFFFHEGQPYLQLATIRSFPLYPLDQLFIHTVINYYVALVYPRFQYLDHIRPTC